MHLKIVLFRRCRHMLLLSSLNKLLCVSCQEATEFTQPVTECEIKCCSSNCFHRARITGPRASEDGDGCQCDWVMVSKHREVEKFCALTPAPTVIRILNPITFAVKWYIFQESGTECCLETLWTLFFMCWQVLWLWDTNTDFSTLSLTLFKKTK